MPVSVPFAAVTAAWAAAAAASFWCTLPSPGAKMTHGSGKPEMVPAGDTPTLPLTLLTPVQLLAPEPPRTAKLAAAPRFTVTVTVANPEMAPLVACTVLA